MIRASPGYPEFAGRSSQKNELFQEAVLGSFPSVGEHEGASLADFPVCAIGKFAYEKSCPDPSLQKFAVNTRWQTRRL
jgi:hypothetical protein